MSFFKFCRPCCLIPNLTQMMIHKRFYRKNQLTSPRNNKSKYWKAYFKPINDRVKSCLKKNRNNKAFSVCSLRFCFKYYYTVLITTPFVSIWRKHMIEWATFDIWKSILFTFEKVHCRLFLMNLKRFTNTHINFMFILLPFNYIFPKV